MSGTMARQDPVFQPKAHARVTRCLEGDPGAWEEFTRAYTPLVEDAVRKTLARLQARHGEAPTDDIVQDVFNGLWQDDKAALREFRWKCRWEEYLGAIATARTVAWARRHLRSVRLENAWAHLALERDLLGSRAAHSMLMEGPESLERKAHVWRALDLLPESERLAVRLVYWDGLDPEQAGRLIGCGPEPVRALLAEGRERLRKLLDEPLSRLEG